MKYILISMLLLATIVSFYYYFKDAKNIFINSPVLIRRAISMFTLTIISVTLLYTNFVFITSIIFLLGVITFWIEMARTESKQIYDKYDGVVRDYEIPIKWINSCRRADNGIIYNEEESRIDSVREIVSHHSKKYVYYVQFKNNKRKLIPKGTLTYEKIKEKFN